jgi:hypothetical protein
MADMTKLRRRPSNLGEPPPLEEASSNLSAPEIAPAFSPPPANDRQDTPQDTPDVISIAPQPRPRSEPKKRARIDGRTLRKTGRTVQLATRVSEDFDDEIRQIAKREGLKIVEVLERAVAAYKAKS